MHHYIKHGKPKLAFDPGIKAEDFPHWRRQVKAKLYELMAFSDLMESPPGPKHIWTKQRDGYNLQRWEAYPESGSVVPFLMLVPDGAHPGNPYPAVYCVFPGRQAAKSCWRENVKKRIEQYHGWIVFYPD